jgi:hypothetical protein
MMTPRRWRNLLISAIALGIGAGAVIALVITFLTEDHVTHRNIPDPAKESVPVVPPVLK